MSRRLFFMGCCLVVSTLIGCQADNPLIVRTEDPMLYVTLSRSGWGPSDTVVSAILGITGTPTRFEYLTADTFEMRRTRDGALFDWRRQDLSPSSIGQFTPREPNYVLSQSASSLGLGRNDLEPGESYDFKVVASGRTIIGGARIPNAPLPEIVNVDGGLVVRWPKVPNAAGYLVGGRLTRDTLVVLGPSSPTSLSLLVTAVDTNWFDFMTGARPTSSGVVGAFGVLGALTAVEVASPRARTP